MWPGAAEPLGHRRGVDHLILDGADLRHDQLRGDVVVVLRHQHGGVGLARAVHLAPGVIAEVEAVGPHLRRRQDVERLGEGNAAAGVGVAGGQRLEAGLGELRLEIARHFDNGGSGRGAVGDAGDAAFGLALVGGLAVLEGRGLQPRRVEILGQIAGDDAAGETADARIIAGAGDVALLRLGGGGKGEAGDEGKTTEQSQTAHRAKSFCHRPSCGNNSRGRPAGNPAHGARDKPGHDV